MKKLIMVLLVLSTSAVYAVSTTDITQNWVCTTNASSSDVATDKAADEQMAKTHNSAASSFEFAVKNCRDCTKITCEAKE
ncbi:hypothetical protein J2N86_15135 (plasmid) [Legionella lytica]|uniref:Uncharacterized protein n=1 Tax=Legionella lytica TaxID=96232 RepID=A0ABY4YCD0_9GAMM|nr:hypothetical protein [Legionella lytica]USQ15294.1 hypothetical protein J2N86_15135 [Legionella lytica]